MAFPYTMTVTLRPDSLLPRFEAISEMTAIWAFDPLPLAP